MCLATVLNEQHLEILRLKGGCTGSSESTLVKIPYCWKSHVMTHIICLVIKMWVGQDESGAFLIIFMLQGQTIL